MAEWGIIDVNAIHTPGFLEWFDQLVATGASSTPSHHMRVASHSARRMKRKYEDDAFSTLLDREEVKIQLETDNLKLQRSTLEMKLVYWQRKVAHMNNWLSTYEWLST